MSSSQQETVVDVDDLRVLGVSLKRITVVGLPYVNSSLPQKPRGAWYQSNIEYYQTHGSEDLCVEHRHNRNYKLQIETAINLSISIAKANII